MAAQRRSCAKCLEENHLKCYGAHIHWTRCLENNLEKTVEFNKALGNNFLVVPWISNRAAGLARRRCLKRPSCS